MNRNDTRGHGHKVRGKVRGHVEQGQCREVMRVKVRGQ